MPIEQKTIVVYKCFIIYANRMIYLSCLKKKDSLMAKLQMHKRKIKAFQVTGSGAVNIYKSMEAYGLPYEKKLLFLQKKNCQLGHQLKTVLF